MTEAESNKPTINWVTRTLCALAIIFGVTMCVLAFLAKDIPDQLNMLAGIVIGGLLSMLTKSTPTPASPAATSPVQLATADGKAVSDTNPLPTDQKP